VYQIGTPRVIFEMTALYQFGISGIDHYYSKGSQNLFTDDDGIFEQFSTPPFFIMAYLDDGSEPT